MHSSRFLLSLLFAGVFAARTLDAQAGNPGSQGTRSPADNQATPPTFATAAADLQTKLTESLAELTALRERIAAEKVPLSRQLHESEKELQAARVESQEVARLLDSHTLDLGNLRTEIQGRRDQSTYLSNLLAEYARNFEVRLHITELQRYQA
ncbi:MAG: hypothetical protein ABIP94_20580, partial [Planctomycetota bacterium]